MKTCFEVLEASDLVSKLTALQDAELRSAANYHALAHPGAHIEFRIAIGSIEQLPVLTDERTLTGAGFDTTPTRTVRVRSTASADPVPDMIPPLVRYLRLAHPEATPTTTAPQAESVPRRLYRALERHSAAALDLLRETITHRREKAIAGPLPRYPNAPDDRGIEAAFSSLEPPTPSPIAPEPAVLIGMHWLQTGGAERWAVDSIRLIQEAGFLPIVVTDQNSVHPWLLLPELEGCLVVCLSSEGAVPHAPELIEAIARSFDLRGVAIHHSTWLYQTLPWIRRWNATIPIVDSLHIVEYLGGGYPGLAARFDECIDMHHTISPELTRWLTHTQGVDPSKVAVAPLSSLTVAERRGFKPRAAADDFTISFVGRLSRQKRPDVFLMLVRQLCLAGAPVRAILHGDGELADLVDKLLDRYKLRGVVEQRFEDTPVSETLGESDLLVVSSMNEGLTLTTFEAVAAGIPAVSADVGSQRTIVKGAQLLPRPARQFVREATREIQRLIGSDERRLEAWQGQQERVEAFSEHQSAQEWFSELLRTWK